MCSLYGKENTSDNELPIFTWCSIDLDNCNYSRRCFMTGEYCSRQDAIQKERQNLRNQDSINAFVVMNFSSVSDVIFKWRIQGFVKSLKDYLFFNPSKNRLYCFNRQFKSGTKSAISDDAIEEIANKEQISRTKLRKQLDRILEDHSSKKNDNKDDPFIPVKEINVIRADSKPSTNFVMCNRICQQLQIADIVIVDVSVKNANVFYELGMAVSLGKMILPICYDEQYFSEKYPVEILSNKKPEIKDLEHHIDCYPLRRELFEHFGIRYRNGQTEYTQRVKALRKQNNTLVADTTGYDLWITQYCSFKDAIKPENGFGDIKYAMFPYLDKVNHNLDGFSKTPTLTDGTIGKTIGECIYKKLQTSYNMSTYDENTLVIYSMDGFLNKAQAAQCIVNYYNAIVRQFFDQHCFCGERVGVLLQPNPILKDPKDGEEMLHYNVGEIIQIGMNQATYKTHMEMIKPDLFLYNNLNHQKSDSSSSINDSAKIQINQWASIVERQTKGFIRNRCISIYPQKPVYVERIMNGIQQDIFRDISLKSTNYKNNEEIARLFFCYFHVMLRTLQFTNEIVVDIGDNSIQSFFWLGAAHASDTSAIIVRHEKTEQEKKASSDEHVPDRSIFDVAGLWTAIYRTDDAESFFEQLYRAQSGIEHYSKLILKNRKEYDDKLSELFWNSKSDIKPIKKKQGEKAEEENETLEAYYRNRFWRSMLRCNRLHLYVRQHCEKERESYVEIWDVDSVGIISNYLSRKKAISDYLVMPLEEETPDPAALDVNLICIGNETGKVICEEEKNRDKTTQLLKSANKNKKKGHSVPDLINAELGKDRKIFCRITKPMYSCLKCCEQSGQAMFKLYCNPDNESELWRTQLPTTQCYECLLHFAEKGEIQNENCEKHDFVRQNKILHSKTKPRTCSLRKSFFRVAGAEHSTIENNVVASYILYHLELAQLVLWRDNNSTDHFRVTVSGASGPATLALSSIIVNKKVKENVFVTAHHKKKQANNMDSFARSYPLFFLQEKIQQELLERYGKKLRSALKKEMWKQKPETIDMRIECIVLSAQMYLSTVLYRYFLPFIDSNDIERICNGMKFYVLSLQRKRFSPISDENIPNKDTRTYNYLDDFASLDVLKIVPRELYELLQQLRGVEAFYEVEVRDTLTKNDKSENRDFQIDRKIVGIRQSSKIKMRCLFVGKQPES